MLFWRSFMSQLSGRFLHPKHQPKIQCGIRIIQPDMSQLLNTTDTVQQVVRATKSFS